MSHISRLLLAATAVFALAGCSVLDRYLKVTSPEQIPTKTAEQPQNAELLSFSAVGDFECAYGVTVVITGLVSGELIDGTQTAARWDYDRRSFEHTTPTYATGTCDGVTDDLGHYTPIQTARHSNDRVLQLLRGWTDAQVSQGAPINRQQLIDTAAVYAGYSRLLLGETMCAAPDSEFGHVKTPAQIFAKAEALFSLVIDSVPLSALGDSSIRLVAYAGRARARLDQGNLAGAAVDAGAIPPGFEFDVTATGGGASAHRQNRINSEQTGLGLSVQAAYRDVRISTTDTMHDTRVAVAQSTTHPIAADHFTPLYVSLKNAAADTPMRVASYQEAQLIIAEANAGSAASVTAINNARAADGLPAYSGPGDLAAVTEERRREFFLETKRLFDITRLSLPLDPTPGVPYSTATRKGGTYQAQTCFPLPDVEKFNNPAA